MKRMRLFNFINLFYNNNHLKMYNVIRLKVNPSRMIMLIIIVIKSVKMNITYNSLSIKSKIKN